jgi:hypothetical protein
MSNLIGSAPDQVPVNGMLGKLAFIDSDPAFSGAIGALQAAPPIASAATIAPTNLITFITGNVTISTITPPTNVLAKGGILILIPKDASTFSTTATGGNIAVASVGSISKALIMTYDSITNKWYPSY